MGDSPRASFMSGSDRMTDGRRRARRSRRAASSRRFPAFSRTTRVDFSVRPGEIHALLGENGAGKSTLMNILDGLYRPDAGEILLDGAAGQLRLAA